MASNLLKLPTRQTFKLPTPSNSSPFPKTLFPSLPLPPQKSLNSLKILSLSIHSSLSSYSPPTSKEEAILQAKTCLSTTLEKPLNNPRLAGKLKRQKQSRFRIEIPVMDDSPESLTQLAFDLFGDLPIRRKAAAQSKITLLWPNNNLTDLAKETFSISNSVENIDMISLTNGSTRFFNSADVAVFMAPEVSQVEVMKLVSDSLAPKPVVMFNPKWVFEEESDLGELRSFVGSFEVVYSFMGMEVRGVFSKRKGVVFKYVRDGILSGEKWAVLVEEEDGELKVVTRFGKRPSIGEVENVLYNLMAVNSPITKSAKFFRDFLSNVTGKK